MAPHNGVMSSKTFIKNDVLTDAESDDVPGARVKPRALPCEGAHTRLTVISSTRVTRLRAVCIRGALHRYKQILGGESLTRWLVWASGIEKVFLPHFLRERKVQFFLPASRV